MTSPPRGWYPDPGGTTAWRWWDGGAWNEDLHAYFPPIEGIDAAQLAREQHAGGRMATIGLGAFGLAALGAIVIRVADTSWLAAMWQWFHSAYDIAKSGSTSATLPAIPTQPNWSSTLSSFLILPLEILALVFTLTTQHRAAKIARALGLKSRIGPTFGVVAWFIPLLNLVVPLMAWLDLFTPRHPGRRSLWLSWAALLVAELLTVGVYASAGHSNLAVGALSGLQVVAFFLAIVAAQRTVHSILAEHALGGQSAGVSAHRPGRSL